MRALQRFRQDNKSLEDYNVEFSTKAAAATGLMHDIQVKDVYVAGLHNNRLREHLAGHMEKPLPVLQAKAMDLAHVFDALKPPAGGSRAIGGANNRMLH